MSKQPSTGKSGFGRDEMTALLGGGLSEVLTRPTTAGWTQPSHRAAVPTTMTTTRDTASRLADLTAAETAEWLRQQQRQKANRVIQATDQKPQRHRIVGKQRQYHQLLLEEQQSLDQTSAQVESNVILEKPVLLNKDQRAVEDDRKQNTRHQSSSIAIAMNSEKQTEVLSATAPIHTGRKRRRYDSSSDDDSVVSNKVTAPKRLDSDDSDSEIDARRQRILEQRRQRQTDGQNTLLGQNKTVEQTDPHINSTLSPAVDIANDIGTTDNNIGTTDNLGKSARRNSSSSGSSEETSSSDNEYSSNSEDDEVKVDQPRFIPKHLRGLTKSITDIENEEMQQMEALKSAQERRKKESRALVQQVITASAQAVPDRESAVEGIMGAQNAMPDDSDDIDTPEQRKDAWEVRELVRLIADMDNERKKLQEEEELAKRRHMTDDERHDAVRHDYQREQRQKSQEKASSMQRYYHKGAFYMEESEWDEKDVRRKADEYAKAATGVDKIDKRTLPKVMQVKKFGFANQNTRYKGLAAEDTTDKTSKLLPLQQRTGKKNH